MGLVPSGLSAVSTALLSVLKAGDHILVCDNVYRPTRNFCDGLRALRSRDHLFRSAGRLDIAALFRPKHSLVMVEAPGSQSLEMPDVPAIAAVAHARGALVIDDNTWATPLFRRALEQGVDISIQAATKYIGGHSDIMFGTYLLMPMRGPRLPKASGCSAFALDPTMCFWPCGDCAPLP